MAKAPTILFINARIAAIESDRFIVMRQIWMPIDAGLVECFPANERVIPRLRIGKDVVVRGRLANNPPSTLDQLHHALVFSR